MATIELTEKDLKVLQIMLDEEIKKNEDMLLAIEGEQYRRMFNMAEMLKERNSMLIGIRERFKN